MKDTLIKILILLGAKLKTDVEFTGIDENGWNVFKAQSIYIKFLGKRINVSNANT